MSAALRTSLIQKAHDEGFASVGICQPDAVPEISDRLDQFVAEGRHGQMGWMAERMHWRGNPAALWPLAKSVIMLAEPYTPDLIRWRFWITRIARQSLSMHKIATTTISSKNA